jgi:SAM-dependent methyltransferase
VKRSTLAFLACPGGAAAEPCGASLRPAEIEGLPSLPSPTDAEELLEGGIACPLCGAVYPIFAGVAILDPEPMQYLRRYQGALCRDIERHGSLSEAAWRWLRQQDRPDVPHDDYGADFRFSQQFLEPWQVAQLLRPDAEVFYGGFGRWLRETLQAGPYALLSRWAGELAVNRGLALDAGCGGGGLVARLAPRFQGVFGVDRSFLALLLARRTLLGSPAPLRRYRLARRRGEERDVPLRVEATPNTDLVVGDCRRLPFPPALFDSVCSANIIDIVGIQEPVKAAHRVLREEGTLLLAAPYYFPDCPAPEGPPEEALRQALEACRLTIELEADGVPWAWATYDRHWRVYFNHCLAARKRR